MESQLFDVLGGWDQSDLMVFCFYDVVSKVTLGEYPTGTKFGSAWFDYEKGTLCLYSEDGETELATFALTLQVQEVTKGDADAV